MRIAIIGAGGIGAPLGASLATAGQDVTFIARGAHLAAMLANGLRIEGDRGSTRVNPVRATDNPATVGPVELVMSCVKLWDLESSAEAMRPLIGSHTAVIPLQNGVDASERLVPILGAEHVLGGVAMVTGSIIEPGLVRQTGKHHAITFGELDGTVNARGEAIRDVCVAAGIDATLTDDIQLARWDKFLGLAAIAGACALSRQSVGGMREDPDLHAVFTGAMAEIVSVGRACGVRFAEHQADKWVTVAAGLPAGATPSMAFDLRNGNRLELRWLNGKVVELGRARGVPTPINDVIYAALKPFANGKAA